MMSQVRRCHWLRDTLNKSQKEAVASSTMTATSDNFLNAFALYLNASLMQMGLLTAIPQIFGAIAQLFSIWVGPRFSRKHLVSRSALVQALVVALMAVLAVCQIDHAVWALLLLAVCYHGLLNLIQPHWRAWMGSLVPPRRRGLFFARRTRLTMMSSLAVFIGGGYLLTATDHAWSEGLGFALLFLLAACGRLTSGRLLAQMHDPETHATDNRRSYRQTLVHCKDAMQDSVFRHYSLFVAGMQGVVALSAPFFAVYMLNELHLSYLQYSLTNVASILTQFVTLGFWGRISDKYGNRVVMLFCSALMPLLPSLWLFAWHFETIILIQLLSGFAWSGFTLATANYLYDLRPQRSSFATYAAVQSALGAIGVFAGALAGGLLASHAQSIRAWLDWDWLSSALYLVFLCSGLLRLAMFLWFLPKAVEPRVLNTPKLLQVVYRVARFNAISGVVLDWLTVSKKNKP